MSLCELYDGFTRFVQELLISWVLMGSRVCDVLLQVYCGLYADFMGCAYGCSGLACAPVS